MAHSSAFYAARVGTLTSDRAVGDGLRYNLDHVGPRPQILVGGAEIPSRSWGDSRSLRLRTANLRRLSISQEHTQALSQSQADRTHRRHKPVEFYRSRRNPSFGIQALALMCSKTRSTL